MPAEHSPWSWLGKRSLILELLLSRARSKRSYQSHKFGQKCSRLPDGRGSVQTADSIEPRASASGVELFDELPGHNTRNPVVRGTGIPACAPLTVDKHRTGKNACATLAVMLACATIGCRRDMQDQPKFIPLRPSDFFADGRSARPLPEGTVARGELRADKVFFTGKNGDQYVDRVPFPVTRAVLERGQERFNIYCSPCHGRLGNGLGMIVLRGLKRPPSYHIDRLRQVPIGYFYDVISNGFGAMADYSAQVAPRDRWAIAAYLRVLQYSQQASVDDVPPEYRQELSGSAASKPSEEKKPPE